MSITDARKLKPGDQVRLKAGGLVFVITGREDSGHTIYGKVNGHHPLTVRNTEIRLTIKGEK